MPKPIPIVFVCAPYTAPTHAAITRNIKFAARAARQLAAYDLGFICPHTNSRHFDDYIDVEPTFWNEMYIAILESCDAMLIVGEWQKSLGCQAEIVHASKHSIPMFHSIPEVLKWAGRTEKSLRSMKR